MDDDKKKVIKRSMSRRVTNAIFRGEDANTFFKDLWKDEVMPMIGDILEEAASRAIRSIFYEDDIDSKSGYRAYGKKSRKKSRLSRDRDRDRKSRRSSSDELPSDLGIRDTDMIPFTSRGEIEDLMDRLARKCRVDGSVSVSDLYSEANVATTNFKTMDYGWDDPHDLKRYVVKKRGGEYFIELPRPHLLEGEDSDDDED